MRTVRRISGFAIALLLSFSGFPDAQKITVQGNRFYRDGCNRIFLNGANTPWNSWNDFGGNFNRSWWDGHFQSLKSNAINSSRVWISCDGSGAVQTNTSGNVTGVGSTFWRDCDSLFKIAERTGVYILATMMSFDHCQDNHANYQRWRAVITDTANSRTYIDNYLIPFVNRYKANPYLFGIDLCNEPEWISENAACGNLPVGNLQRFFAMSAAAVHGSGGPPVSIGSACIKWNSDNNGHVGNYWKNAALQAAYNDPKAFVDFYQIHYYAWVNPYFSNPFQKSPADYGIDDRPVIIGECPAKDMGEIPQTISQAFESALAGGYQGCMPWTSNGVDGNGSLSTLGPATQSFKNNHGSLVYPAACPTSVQRLVPELNLALYPNPANDFLNVEGISGTGKICLYNASGERVYSNTRAGQTGFRISLKGLRPGLYILSADKVSGRLNKKITVCR